VRKQYHFRPSAAGLRAWDVDRLVALTRGLQPELVPIAAIREIDEPYWNDPMTGRAVAEHARLIAEADLAYPIILSSDGRVMHGMHRVLKALMRGDAHIRAVRFPADPEPDFVGVDPAELPYADRVVIRAARPEEAGMLSTIAREAKAMWGYSTEVLEAWKDQLTIAATDIGSRPVFVAEVDSLVTGLYSLARAGSEWELDNLWVAPAHGRRGVGRALLKHALLQARLGGAERVLVDSDPNAEAFYLKAGATRVGEVGAPIPGEPSRVRPQLAFAIPGMADRR
jgi:ribosomal protein S18 acetylase RimI-like enzyme